MGKDARLVVAERIIEIMEREQTLIWQKPWNGGVAPANMVTGHKYSGVNKFFLGFAAKIRGYELPLFASFKQIQKLQGTVRRGERSFPCCFWKKAMFDKQRGKFVSDREAERIENAIDRAKDSGNLARLEELNKRYGTVMVFRYYNVFNIDQVTWPAGVREKIVDKFICNANEGFRPKEDIEAVLRGFKMAPAVQIIKGADEACYYPDIHVINLPSPKQFSSDDDFYKVWAHEAVHSTGHEYILNRDLSRKDEKCSFEELIAEIGAAMISSEFRLEPKVDDEKNSAAYVKSWLRYLKNDKTMVLKAAQKACKAVDWILDTSHKNENVQPVAQ